MDCPRCDGQITVFELEDAVSRVCEDCSYVGVLADHRSTDVDTESWNDALTRLRTEFSESDPDGVSRVDEDTAPPEDAGDGDRTAEDSGFHFRGAPEATRVAESGPQPGTDFPVGETGSNPLHSGDATVVALPETGDRTADGDETVRRSDERNFKSDSGSSDHVMPEDQDTSAEGPGSGDQSGESAEDDHVSEKGDWTDDSAGETQADARTGPRTNGRATEAVGPKPADPDEETDADDTLTDHQERDVETNDEKTGDEESDTGQSEGDGSDDREGESEDTEAEPDDE